MQLHAVISTAYSYAWDMAHPSVRERRLNACIGLHIKQESLANVKARNSRVCMKTCFCHLTVV